MTEAQDTFKQWAIGEFDVASVVWKSHFKKIRLEPGSLWISIPRSACVTKGDRVLLSSGELTVICKNGLALLLPTYVAREVVQLGNIDLPIVIKEITESDEFKAYQSLADFHYRGHELHGRTARLVVRAFHPTFPQVIGFVELATPFYMNKPRSQILDAPFSYNGLGWDHWGMDEQRKYIHLLVRIARCVVYPEFRGLGLGQALIKHAARFAAERWQVAGLKPLFLEISADMLKYVPFAERAGMTYVGETEGNLSRVYKDMSYLLRNASRVEAGEILSESSHGMVDKQLDRMRNALELMREEGLELDEFLNRLYDLSREEVLRDFALFHDIVSLPKPTYLQGLNHDADEFIRQRAQDVAPPNGHTYSLPGIDPISEPIALECLSVSFHSKVRRTRQTHAIQQAFGISPDDISTTIIQDLSLRIEPGEVVLIVGPSGSGKTTLLHILLEDESAYPDQLRVAGDISVPSNYRPGALKETRSKRALVDVLGSKDVRTTLNLMGMVGLSDAYVYLRRFEELSKGQQFRAMLANLIVGHKNVWIIDELCANLDPVTANVVADKLQRTARRMGVTVIAAAPHCQSFVESLSPDRVVKLTNAWEYFVLSGQDFIASLPKSRTGGLGPSYLRIDPRYLGWAKSGRKTSTIRKGRLRIGPGLLLLESGKETMAVNVVETSYRQFRNLDEANAKADGFKNVGILRKALRNHYPDVKDTHYFTVIDFETFSTVST